MKNAFRKLRGKKDESEERSKSAASEQRGSGPMGPSTSKPQSLVTPPMQNQPASRASIPPLSSQSSQLPTTSLPYRPLPATLPSRQQPPAAGQLSRTRPAAQTSQPRSAQSQLGSRYPPLGPSIGRPGSYLPNGALSPPMAQPPMAQLSTMLSAPASSTNIEELRNLIQISQPALCPVCCNFDPYKAPRDGESDERQPSWARTEYKIPAGTPVGKITIEKSEELVAAAQNGCLYCCMVRIALGAVHEGWETEKSFIDIYLAPNLPVVVRLTFGGTSTVTLGREAMLELGIDLPEGQNMNFTITIEDTDKPPIYVEIYRPTVDSEATTAGDLALTPLVEHMGAGLEIPTHSGDPQSFDFVKEKLSECMRNHRCGRDGHLPLLPDRVIWIEANNATRIQLVEPKNIRAKYICLSYCWGSVSPSTYLTNASTFKSRKDGINYIDLPPLFQDVVNCARGLGIEYIWIDRLCIIQGDEADFHIQAPKMGEIYGNATLTIAAASASSESDRILAERDAKWLSYDLNMNVNGIGSLRLKLRRRTHPLGGERKGGDYGKVSTRAWIWQERLLSGRTVFYTPSALKFECHHHSVWEGFGPGTVGHSWSSQLDNITHLSWLDLVEEYMGRDITRQSDRLPAMESVMKRIEKSHGWSPLWGMWANALVESLGWEAQETKSGGGHRCRMNPKYLAPTWSWASVDGPISYAAVRPMGSSLEERDPMIYDLEVRKLDAESGLITLAGQIISVELSCRIEETTLDEAHDGIQAGEKALRYSYEILNLYTDGKPFPIRPDVALKPWTGIIGGRRLSTIIRVPHGESPPEKSWTGSCLCVLVHRMKMRTLVILVGGSLRQQGAWERIGATSGLHPSIFANSPRQIVNIA